MQVSTALKGHIFMVAGGEVSVADLNYVKTDIEITGPTILYNGVSTPMSILPPFHKIFIIFLPGLSVLAISKIKNIFTLIVPCPELPMCLSKLSLGTLKTY